MTRRRKEALKVRRGHAGRQGHVHPFRVVEAAFFCVMAVVAVRPISAAEEDVGQRPEIVGVRVGLADRYKAGLWTQVEVLLRGGDQPVAGEVSVIVPDGDGVLGRVSTPPEEPCALTPGRQTSVRLISRFGRVHGGMTVELRVAGEVAARKTFETGAQADGGHFLPALESRKLVVVLGGADLGIEDLGRRGDLEPGARPVVAHLERAEQLPTHWIAYEGVDAVVLSTSHPEIIRRLTADGLRWKALEQWVRMGGRLVLSVGSQAETVLAADSPLLAFIPGRLERMVRLRQTGALEVYCGSRSAILHGNGDSSVIRAPQMGQVQGRIEASEADLPLVIRAARGLGQVIFVAVDLDRSPLKDWSDRPLLLARLLDMHVESREESRDNAAMMHFGFNDISGQLRSALDHFTGVRTASFSLVAGLIVLYILLIGPGEYFLLRKWFGRMEWTWLTFPLILAAMGLAAWGGALWLKGDRLRTHQVDLVDIDVASGRIRGTTWVNLFSPRATSYDLTVQPCLFQKTEAEDANVWMGWLGLPGSALGGMNPRSAGPLLSTAQFRYAPSLKELFGVPIPIWSTKSLTARWQANADVVPEAELAEVDQYLSGSITNTLPFTLRDCIVAYGRSVYEIGALAPGEAARLGPMAKRSELRTLLTGRKAMFSEDNKTRQEATPYDQSSTNPFYILRIMMFFEAAGGRRYTGLGNGYQEFVDMSSLLKADRAILVARGPDPTPDGPCGATLLCDGKPVADAHAQHLTMYRFVFPVKSESAAVGSRRSVLPLGSLVTSRPPPALPCPADAAIARGAFFTHSISNARFAACLSCGKTGWFLRDRLAPSNENPYYYLPFRLGSTP